MKELKLYREPNGQYSTSESINHDVSGVYVQKTDYDELKRENEELRAYSNRVENALVICDAQHNGSYIGCGLVQEVLEETISKSLADVKADAVLSVINSINPRGEVAGGDDAYSGEDIQEHAENLRGESK